jgi:hypothetical protein
MMEIQLQIDKANMNWNAYKNKKVFVVVVHLC